MFSNEPGRPYYPEYFDTRFDRLAAEAGLRRLRLHDTRHTARSIMAHAGVPAYVRAQILGDASARMVEAVYRDVLLGVTDKTGQAISALLLGEGR